MADEFDKYKQELERRRRELLKLGREPSLPARSAPQPPRYGRLPPVAEEHTRFFASKKFWLIAIMIIILVAVLVFAINFTQQDITEEDLEKAREAKFLEAVGETEVEEIIVPEKDKAMRELEAEIVQGFKDMGAMFSIRNFQFKRTGDDIELVHDLDMMSVDYNNGRYEVVFFEKINLIDPAGNQVQWFDDKYSTTASITVDGGTYQTVTRTFTEPVSKFGMRGVYKMTIRATDATPFIVDEKTFEFRIE